MSVENIRYRSILTSSVGIKRMKKRTVITIRIAYALVILGLALLALPAVIAPRRSASERACIKNLRLIDAALQAEVERDMLGWPVRKVSPEEERRNHERALAALRQMTAEQKTKVAVLRERLTSARDPKSAAEELAHQEKILAALRKRHEDEENANNPSHHTAESRAGARLPASGER